MRLTKTLLAALLVARCTGTPEAPSEQPEPAPAGSGADPQIVSKQQSQPSPVEGALLRRAEAVLRLWEIGQDEAWVRERFELIVQEALQKGFPQHAVEMKRTYAERLQAQGIYEEAFEVLLEIRKVARNHRIDKYEAMALNQMGQIRGPGQQQWEIALSLYQEALGVYDPDVNAAARLAQEIGLLIPIIVGNIGMSYGRLGNFELGLQLLHQAVEIQLQLGNTGGLEKRWNELGNVYFLKEEYSQAAECYKEALNLKLGASWANNLAIALTELEDWQEAEWFHQQAQELGITDQPGSQAYWSWAGGRIAASQGALDEAERRYRQALGQAEGKPSVQWSAQADLGRLMAAYDWPRSRHHFERAIALVGGAQQALQENENRMLFFSRLIRFFQDYVEILIERGESQQALRIVESSRARILTGKLELAGFDLPPAIDYRALAAPGTAFLSYWLAPQASYLWLVSQREVKLVELPPKDEIEQRVGAYSVKGGWDLEAGGWLYDRLLSPVAAEISAMDRIVVIPDGELHFLNFETLPLPGSAGRRRPRYFIEEATLSVAPALYSKQRAEKAFSAPHNSLLLVGNPVRAGDPPLPHADEEIRAISAIFSGWRRRILQQDEATPKAFLDIEAKDSFRLIHFASHAVDNPSNPLESYISLSESGPEGSLSRLFAKDLLPSLDEPFLQADLVTLSACGTAGGRALGGEGLVGLSWAFLTAGARNVVATLWEAGDRAAFEIMKDFYRRVRAGEPYSQALRQAKLRLVGIEKGSLHKPEYWGPFQLHSAIGAGSFGQSRKAAKNAD